MLSDQRSRVNVKSWNLEVDNEKQVMQIAVSNWLTLVQQLELREIYQIYTHQTNVGTASNLSYVFCFLDWLFNISIRHLSSNLSMKLRAVDLEAVSSIWQF